MGKILKILLFYLKELLEDKYNNLCTKILMLSIYMTI